MTGASIETTLELWASSLREVKGRMRGLFTQGRVAASANLFLDGLLSDERRKTGWMRAEAGGGLVHGGKRPFWAEGGGTRTNFAISFREYVIENLATDDAVLVIDETGFLKQGKASCGVARQYTGSAGKITNCQIGVFAANVSARGHAFIDRALYLPKSWTGDPTRLAATYAPDAVAFATKPVLAVQMIQRALTAGVPFSWVAADAVYGVGDVEQALRRARKGYVLGVKSDHFFGSWSGKPPVAGKAAHFAKTGAEEIAQALDPSTWKRLSAGEGTKGACCATIKVSLIKIVALQVPDFMTGPIVNSPISTPTNMMRRNQVFGLAAS